MTECQSCVAPVTILPNLHRRKYCTCPTTDFALNAGPIVIVKRLDCIRRNALDRWRLALLGICPGCFRHHNGAATIMSSTVTLWAAGAGVPTQPHNLSKLLAPRCRLGQAHRFVGNNSLKAPLNSSAHGEHSSTSTGEFRWN
jgi:hypothetical protein